MIRSQYNFTSKFDSLNKYCNMRKYLIDLLRLPQTWELVLNTFINYISKPAMQKWWRNIVKVEEIHKETWIKEIVWVT